MNLIILKTTLHTHTHSITDDDTLFQAAEDVSENDELPEVQIHGEVSENPTQKS